MEGKLKTKKEISINRFFLIFLTHAILSLAVTAFLWAGLLTAAAAFHIIVPANAVERSVSVWCDTLDGHRAITPDEIPSGADYAFFDKKGMLVQTNLKEGALKAAREMAVQSKPGDIRRNGTSISLRIFTDTQCVIVSYRLIARFASPALRCVFPNAELFFFVLLFFMLVADLILISVRYARKLNKELQKLAAVAGQIGQQTLAFEIQKTRLLEFNRIMDSLEHLKTDLQCSLEEQWEMEQQKKRQLTALAHDIKTPLAIVTGNAELLLETKQTGEQREYSAFILEHARQIQRYVTGMLEISRPVNNPDGICEIRRLLQEAAENAESLGKKKHLSCVLYSENLPDTIPFPKDGLWRILCNLIDNAVQYSPDSGTIFLSALIKENMLQLSVRDEGEGFSGEALSFASTEFYRADRSRGSKEHFGLGLAIAKQIITELGGTLLLENAPERGALVMVNLPIIK